jgi:hypothetical protein
VKWQGMRASFGFGLTVDEKVGEPTGGGERRRRRGGRKGRKGRKRKRRRKVKGKWTKKGRKEINRKETFGRLNILHPVNLS